MIIPEKLNRYIRAQLKKRFAGVILVLVKRTDSDSVVADVKLYHKADLSDS